MGKNGKIFFRNMRMKRIDAHVIGCTKFGKMEKGTLFSSSLIGPKLFQSEAYLTCVSSKLCEFIATKVMW